MRENVDQIFRRKLGNGTLPIPQELWDRLEPHLPKEERRRPKGLIWLLGAGLLVLIGALAVYLSKTNAQPGTPRAAELSTASSETTSTLPNNTAAIAATQETLTSKTEIQDQGTIGIRPDISKEITSKALNQYQSTKSNDPQITSMPSSERADNDVLLSDLERSSNSSSSDASPALQVENKTSTGIRFPIYIALLEETDATLPIFRRRLPDPAKDCYRFGKKNNGGGGILFAEAYAGPLLSSKKMTSRSEDVSSYIQSRDSTESSRVSWNAGLRLGYWHSSGITARVGGHYTVVNELFDYYDGSSTSTVITFDTIRDGQGNIITINADTLTITGQRIKKTHNRYHTIDVPLLLGYQVSHGHWAFGIQGGPVFNLAFRQKGDILAPDGKPVSIRSSDANPYPAYKDKLGMSVYFSAHAAKRFGYRFWVYAEPFVHHRLKTLTLDSYPIDQRQTNFGLSIGLRATLR